MRRESLFDIRRKTEVGPARVANASKQVHVSGVALIHDNLKQQDLRPDWTLASPAELAWSGKGLQELPMAFVQGES